ncbi:MAG: tubulin-like doman-containing protein [Thermomicrobiales bacterium]
MPGIFIGIGGIGGSIVTKLADALKVHVSLAADSLPAQQAANQFRFLLLDTWKDGVSAGFDASQVLDLPEGKDKFDVDAKVESWWRGGDNAFRSWWPQRGLPGSETGAPLLAGPYASGAGQLRVKGRLAYRISLTGLGRQAMPSVMAGLREIDAVLGPAAGIRTVPVYLVSSLGGGSGSGMVLTFAQHLRQTLPEYCPIIGVFPLASVTEMGPGAADRSSIWANTDSALREIDYCQRVAGTPDNVLSPFFQWPGQGNVIYGDKRPFEYIYLFGRDNQSGQSLDEFSKYIDLMAETLIAESFAGLDDEGLPNAILGPHSQFIMQLQARPSVGDRPTTYASAAVAALVFPSERVERHLARRFAIKVLDAMTTPDEARAHASANEFLQKHVLLWDGKPPLRTKFDEAVTEQPGNKKKNAPRFNSTVSASENSPFMKAAAAGTTAMALEAERQLDGFVDKQLVSHYAKRSDEIVAAYAGPDGQLRTQVDQWLSEQGATALGFAYAAVTEIRQQLSAQWRHMNDLIDGNKETGKIGTIDELHQTRESYKAAANRLPSQIGSGLPGIFSRNGKNARQRFVTSQYNKLVASTTDLQRMRAARSTYLALGVETNRVQRVLKELNDKANDLRRDLERETEHDVGEHGRTGVLDLAVLDDPRLLAHHFRDVLEETSRSGVESCAIRVTVPADKGVNPSTFDAAIEEDALEQAPRDALATTGIVSITLRRALDPATGASQLVWDRYKDQLAAGIVADGVSRLSPRVRDMSIWDALAAECQARTALNLHDAAVEQAERDIKKQRQNAEDAGVPPRDWEQELLRFFIRRRLEDVQKRVRPFWNLNGLMTANHGQAYGFVVLATDRKAYELAETTHGIRGFLGIVTSLMQAGTPKWLPGKDRIVLYSREGVVPLFYLNDRELKMMRDSSAQKARDKFLYTDARFAHCVDPVVRPAEAPNERLLYAIGMGLQLGVIEWERGSAAGLATLHLGDASQVADSLGELAAMLEVDQALATHFRNKVDAIIHGLSEDQQQAVQHRAQITVAEAMRADGARKPGKDDLTLLTTIEEAILLRMNYGQPFVND